MNRALNATKQKYRYMNNNNLSEHKFGLFGKVEKKEDIVNELKDLNLKLSKLLDDIEKDKLNQKLFSGVVFATFKNGKDYEEYLESFPNSFFGLIFKVYIPYVFSNYLCCYFFSEKKRKKYRLFSQLNVEKAPEPTDIKWENLRYTSTQKLVRSIIVYLISLALIVICLVLVVLLTKAQNDIKQLENIIPNSDEINSLKEIYEDLITQQEREHNKLLENISKKSLKPKQQKTMFETIMFKIKLIILYIINILTTYPINTAFKIIHMFRDILIEKPLRLAYKIGDKFILSPYRWFRNKINPFSN